MGILAVEIGTILLALLFGGGATATEGKTVLPQAGWQAAHPSAASKGPSSAAMRVAATTDGWRQFLALPAAELQAKWQGNLSGVHWSWRLGWVQVCDRLIPDTRDKLLIQAMGDQAAVVRAAAAEKVADLFAETDSKFAKELIRAGLTNPANLRHGKPLFVQQRLLWALYNVQRPAQREIEPPEEVAGYPELVSYWQRLSPVSR